MDSPSEYPSLTRVDSINQIIKKYYLDVAGYFLLSAAYFIFTIQNNLLMCTISAIGSLIHFTVHTGLMLQGYIKYTRSLIIHHFISIMLLCWVLLHQTNVTYIGIYFLVEINTAFLLLRRRVQRGTLLHYITDKLHTHTWIIFRLIMYPLLTIHVWYNEFIFSVYSYYFLMINHISMLCVYLYWSALMYGKNE
jgi:hypothetical protein